MEQYKSTRHNSNTKPATDFGNCEQVDIGAGGLYAQKTSHFNLGVMSWSVNISHFVIKNISCITSVAVCIVIAGQLITIY